MNPDDFIRRSIQGMNVPAYPDSMPGYLRLDANTSLFGENPAGAIRSEAPLVEYPSGVSTPLVQALAEYHGVSENQVIVGNGSDGLIDHLTKVFLNPGDPLVLPTPGFVMYSFYGKVNLGRIREVPLHSPGFQLDVAEMVEMGGHLTFVASPNNPTGNTFPEEDLVRLIRQSRGVVVLDEAYADFSDQDFTQRVNEFDNLIVLRTFSKAHGLAGIRVGYAIGSPVLIEKLYLAKAAFEVSALHEEIAVRALHDTRYLRCCVDTIRKERIRVTEEISTFGWKVFPSEANFLFLDVGYAPVVKAFLKERKILVRDFPSMNSFLRVTLGPPEVNDQFLSAMREWRAQSE